MATCLRKGGTSYEEPRAWDQSFCDSFTQCRSSARGVPYRSEASQQHLLCIPDSAVELGELNELHCLVRLILRMQVLHEQL